MFNLEILVQAVKALFTNKLRSSLTLLALVIGVFSVLVSTTAVAVLDNYFKETLSMMGSDVVIVSRYPAIQIGGDTSKRNRKRLTFETFDQVEKYEQLLRYAENMNPNEDFTYTKIQFGDLETEPNVGIFGSNHNFVSNNAYEIYSGRNITQEDVQYSRSVAILGHDVLDELFRSVDPIGKEIRIDGNTLSLIHI